MAIMARLIYSSFHSGKGEYMDLVKRVNETIHIGEDWRRAYTIVDDISLNNASAICKVRTKQGKVLCEAETSVNGQTIYVTIPKDSTLSIDKAYNKAQYDVFLILEERTYKLIMGEITIIHDVSMH